MTDGRILCVAAFLACAAAGAGAETNENVELMLWRSPEFQRQFLGTYGVRAEIEPRVTPEERLEFEQRRRLQLALEELPEEQRVTFLLRMENGLGLDEISEVTGAGRETVKSRLRYALARIRARFEA